VHSQLVGAALSHHAKNYLLLYDEWPVLVVCLPVGDVPFEQELDAAETSPGTLPYRTECTHEETPSKKLPAAAPDNRESRMSVLTSILQNTRGFALSLRKRVSGSPYPDRISVGRARNQDIVLRHASVSKFHAWFEGGAGVVYVADAGSTNGTTVNGKALAPRAKTAVGPGDTVRFGTIDTFLCQARDLWDFLRT
jgi:hypothetical protein